MRSAVALLIVSSIALVTLACGGVFGSAPTPTPTVSPTITTTPTPAPTATPTPTPDPLVLDSVAPALADLQQRMQQEIAAFQQRVGGNFAVAVTDLQTGETVHINGDDGNRIPGCSLNFFVLLSVVQDL